MLTRLHNKIMMFDQIRAADDYDDLSSAQAFKIYRIDPYECTGLYCT